MVVKLIKGIEVTAFYKAGVGDFEGKQLGSKLTLFSFVSWLNGYVPYAPSLVVTHWTI